MPVPTAATLAVLSKPPSTGWLITDAFNRADTSSGLGSSDTGQPWATVGGALTNYGISSNQADATAVLSAYKLAVIDTGHGDVDLTITFPTIELNTYCGLAFRVQDASNFFVLEGKGASGRWSLYKTAGGTQTGVLLDTGVNAASGDTVRVVASSSAITVYVNGVSKGTTSQGAFLSATKHGFYIFSSTVTRADNVQMKNP